MLDRVLAEAKQSNSWLHGTIEPDRIGAAGHSLGAFTTYTLAYNSQCRDPSHQSGGHLVSRYRRVFPQPRHAVARSARDEPISQAPGVEAFHRAARPKFFMTMMGGTHTSDELGGTTPGPRALTEAMIVFFDWLPRGENHALRVLYKVASQPGVTSLDPLP